MEQEKQVEGQCPVQSELSMPRFDEEATLLSARQVVPLIEVKSHARLRRRVVFIVVGIIALLGGTLYGTLIYRPRAQKETLANQIEPRNSGQPSQVAPPAEGGGTSAENAVSIPTKEDADTSSAQEFDRQQTSRVSKPVTRPETEIDAGRSSYGQNDAGGQAIRRPERMARFRRREEGEVRRQKARNSDGLLRIQEIFEGQQKP